MNIDWYRLPFKHYPGLQSLGFSLAQLDKAYAYGSITETEYRWRVFFWEWGAVRLAGKAGRLQDRCYEAFGLAGVDRRIARVKKMKERYTMAKYGQWISQL